jgi:P27 family predicted phage terminase small subunit
MKEVDVRGRKPIPTHLKILRGNPGKRRLNSDEPIPEGDLKDPPNWLSESQKAGWNYAIEHAPKGLLKKLDCSALVAWVVAQDMHRQATEMVARHGLLIRAPATGVPIQSPYVPIINRQAGIMLKAAEQLGFTPVARSRVQVVNESSSNASTNPFAELRRLCLEDQNAYR